MEPMEESPAHGAARAVSALALGRVFLRIGAIAFGGLGAALALVERELVDKRRWLTPADLTEALTYTKLLPGSTVVQVVAYLGYKLRGWPRSMWRPRPYRPSDQPSTGSRPLWWASCSPPPIGSARPILRDR